MRFDTDFPINIPVLIGQLRDALGHEPPGVATRDPQSLPNGTTVPGVVVIPDEVDAGVAQSVIDAHQAAAQAAANEAATEESNRTSLDDRASAALQANRDFLALTSYTNADIVAQVKALTRQNNALIRLVLKRFDGTN